MAQGLFWKRGLKECKSWNTSNSTIMVKSLFSTRQNLESPWKHISIFIYEAISHRFIWVGNAYLKCRWHHHVAWGHIMKEKRKQPEHHCLPFSASWLRTWCEQLLQFLWLWSLFLPQWVVFPCLYAKIKIFSLKLLCHFCRYLIAATRNVSGVPWTTELCSLFQENVAKYFIVSKYHAFFISIYLLIDTSVFF